MGGGDVELLWKDPAKWVGLEEEARGPEEKELVASLALGGNGLVTDRHKRFRENLRFRENFIMCSRQELGKAALATALGRQQAIHCWRLDSCRETHLVLCPVSGREGTRRTWGRDYPSGPVARTPHSRCRGLGFDPWSGNQI